MALCENEVFSKSEIINLALYPSLAYHDSDVGGLYQSRQNQPH